jgi:hypothetical protein
VRPYYSHAGITIYHGDCRDVIPGIMADTLITDPPWPKCEHIKITGSKNAQELFNEVIPMLKVKRIAIQIGTKCDPRFLNVINLPFFRTCKMDFTIPSRRGRILYTHDDAYLYGVVPKSKPHQHLIMGGCRASPSFVDFKNSDHPCARRLEHMMFLVKWWSENEDVILDPFMGSGTTIRAAKEFRRKAIGIEIEERHCETAAQRMSQEVLSI